MLNKAMLKCYDPMSYMNREESDEDPCCLSGKRRQENSVFKDEESFCFNSYNPSNVPHDMVLNTSCGTIVSQGRNFYTVMRFAFSWEADHCDIEARRKLFSCREISIE